MADWPDLKLEHGLLDGIVISPHVLVRVAVFSTMEFSGGPRGKGRPTISTPERLAGNTQYKIEQLAGQRLSQSDADLYFWLLAKAYEDGPPSGEAKVYFNRSEVLTALGRSRGGKTDDLLDESLNRLFDSAFNFINPAFTGRARLLSIIKRFTPGECKFDYSVEIPGEVGWMFAQGWSKLYADERARLKSPLARGLHAYFFSHKEVHPTKSETLKGLMGRNGEQKTKGMQDSKWKKALKDALAEVKEVTGWPTCDLHESGNHAGKVVVMHGKGRARRRPRYSPPETEE